MRRRRPAVRALAWALPVVAAMGWALEARAQDDSRGHLRLYSGAALLSDDSVVAIDENRTSVVGGAIGLSPVPELKLDLVDVAWRRYDEDDPLELFEMVSVFANAAYVPRQESVVRPLIGVGLGVLFFRSEARGDIGVETDTELGLSLRAGLEIEILEGLSLVPEYRLIAAPGFDEDFVSNEVGLAVQLSLR